MASHTLTNNLSEAFLIIAGCDDAFDMMSTINAVSRKMQQTPATAHAALKSVMNTVVITY